MRPLCSAAGVRPCVRCCNSGNHQLKQSILPGGQSDASVSVAPGELAACDHLSLGTECQNVLRCCPGLHGPGDGQVGGVGECPGDVAGERDVISLWDFWGQSLGGDPKRVGDD